MNAEWEGDLLLALQCHLDILSYFVSAGHNKYARYITTYLQEVNVLLKEVQENLLDGRLICRHRKGAPGVSADQFVEQTYIKQGI